MNCEEFKQYIIEKGSKVEITPDKFGYILNLEKDPIKCVNFDINYYGNAYYADLYLSVKQIRYNESLDCIQRMKKTFSMYNGFKETIRWERLPMIGDKIVFNKREYRFFNSDAEMFDALSKYSDETKEQRRLIVQKQINAISKQIKGYRKEIENKRIAIDNLENKLSNLMYKKNNI